MKFVSDRQYYGDLYVVDGKKLSPYTNKKLQLTNGWGFVKVVENMSFNKVKVDVYYLDFSGFYPVNYISTEIVEKEDIIELNWPMVMYMYNTQGFQFIIENYLHYLEIFIVTSEEWLGHKLGIYQYPHCFDSDKSIMTFEGDWDEQHLNITDFMIKYAENFDFETHIKQLKQKYNIK